MRNGILDSTRDHLVIGLGGAGSKIVSRLLDETPSAPPSQRVRFETKDYVFRGLDGNYQYSEQDGMYFRKILKNVRRVLIVACAGGDAGGTMSRFLTMHARFCNLEVDIALTLPADWEGQRRRSRGLGAEMDLRAMGANVKVFFGEHLDATNPDLSRVEYFDQFDQMVMAWVRAWMASTLVSTTC